MVRDWKESKTLQRLPFTFKNFFLVQNQIYLQAEAEWTWHESWFI